MKKIEKIVSKNLRWIVLIISVIILIALVENLMKNDIVNFDNTVYGIISKLISEPVTTIAIIITTLGSVYVIVPVFVASIVIFREKIEAKIITINLFTIFISNQILKRIVARPRPIEYRLVQESGYSFPSGHSMISMAFYGLFIYLIYRKVKNPYIKWISITLISIFIILIGISRIYLGVHYASDVIAGFCISLAYLSLFTHIISEKI